MSLLEFMKYMNANPDLLQRHRGDLRAFIEQHDEQLRAKGILLSQEDVEAVQHFLPRSSQLGPLETTEDVEAVQHFSPRSSQLGPLETTTVMRVFIEEVQTLMPINNLDSITVGVYANSKDHVFFAEPQISTVPKVANPKYQEHQEHQDKDDGDKDKSVYACLLSNSWISYNQDGSNPQFQLNICYTDPEDILDRPQVLYISTQPTSTGLIDGNRITTNIAFKKITLTITGHILVIDRSKNAHGISVIQNNSASISVMNSRSRASQPLTYDLLITFPPPKKPPTKTC